MNRNSLCSLSSSSIALIYIGKCGHERVRCNIESGDLETERTRANGVKLNSKRGKLKDWINDEGEEEEEEEEEEQEEEEEEEEKKRRKKKKEKRRNTK